MLDDLKYIHEKDGQDALGVAAKQWQQYQQDFGFKWQPPREVHSVIVVGMGGSGLAAKIAKSWPSLSVPFEIVQDYNWRDEITENTLLICCSYSGNTEEVLTHFDQALDNDYPAELRPIVVAVTAGGEVAKKASTNNIPLIKLPEGYQPRATVGYQLRALIEIFTQAHLVSGLTEQLDTAATWLNGQINNWLPTLPVSANPAKQVAQELMGKSVVIYAGPLLFPAAYKWKISFNENAKHIAWCNQLPEFNHNEMLGWTQQPVQKPYGVIDLRSNLEHPKVQKRFEVTERLLSGLRPAPIVVTPQGSNLLEQMIWTIALGDFVSLYLALLNGINPTPVDLIEKFKKSLDS